MKQPYNTTIYNTALYMRLSRDDENYGDSVSIETQRTILQQYAKEQGLHVVGEYVDDGWSGTNFERPDFQRMMDDMEAGKVNCIVTKDLSRFGREHVMMDYYLEFLFPEKRVRYIAVAENEDTEKGLSDFVPFKNLFNEWFAKDTSRKVKAAFKAKFATGQRIGAYAPIGYRKHPEIKNKLIIDEETRWIVEKIFDLAIHGRGAASITRILIMEKVPTPGFINFQRDGTFANIYAGAPEEKSYAWTIAQVKSIMKDETYIGHTIHYRETNISFKNKRRVRKPQSEWVRVENTQEPIISEQVFRQVQEQIASRRRERKNGTTQIFAGLIKCADCGWSLAYGENRQNSKPYGYYHCSKNGQGTRQCSMHYIRYDVLYAYVLSRLQYWSALVQHDEEQLLKRLLNANDKGQAAARKKQAAELKKAEKRKAEVDTLFARMYEDWAAGRITEYNFNMLSGKYQSIFVEKELQRVNREAMADLNGKDIMFKFPPTFASTHTALVLKTPKTKTSVRKVFLPKTVAEMLAQRKADIEELKDLFGDEFVDFNLVFCSSNGKPIEGQVINRAFNKLIEENGLPKVVFHSLRHSSITYKLKLNGGDMKSVQGDSGHAQVKMVADVYSHIIDDDRRLNAERLEAAFYSGRQATPEPVQPVTQESSTDDKELLLKLLQNPEMAALLKSLAKTL